MKEDFVSSNEVLNSWKEIAAYLNRGVRTVQRWEIELSLPVRRPRGRTRSAVLALRSELDEWIRSAPLENGASAPGDQWQNGGANGNRSAVAPTTALISELRALRSEVMRSRAEVRDALAELIANLRRIRPAEICGAGDGWSLEQESWRGFRDHHTVVGRARKDSQAQ